jgi:hypothetical protein
VGAAVARHAVRAAVRLGVVVRARSVTGRGRQPIDKPGHLQEAERERQQMEEAAKGAGHAPRSTPTAAGLQRRRWGGVHAHRAAGRSAKWSW